MDSVHSATERRRGAPPYGHRLTRDRVIAKAAELITDQGMDGFSLRQLADVLDVAPNALYNHIRDREELLDAVTDSVLADIQLPAVEQSWQEWIATVAGDLRCQLLAHRGLTELILARAGSTAAGSDVLSGFLDQLETAGVDRAVAHVAWHAVLTAVVGSLAQDRADPDRGDLTFDTVLELVVSGLQTAAEQPPSAHASALLEAHPLAQPPSHRGGAANDPDR